MERSQLFDLMGELKLYGIKAAFDEIMATALKRQHEPQRIIGDLLTAGVNEKQARSSRVQHLAASLRQRKELRRKPYHPIGMGLLYLTEIAATHFLRSGILRHFKKLHHSFSSDCSDCFAAHSRCRCRHISASRCCSGYR
jgi:hypothetical protein